MSDLAEHTLISSTSTEPTASHDFPDTVVSKVWPPQGFLLGQISKIDSEGHGHLTVYDGEQILSYPSGRPATDVSFTNQDLNLKKYDWVVFIAKLASAKQQRSAQNGELIEAQGDSIWKAYHQAVSMDSLAEFRQLLLSTTQRGSLAGFLTFGERLFYVEHYSEGVEKRFRARHELVQKRERELEQKYQVFEQQLQERISQQLSQEQAQAKKAQELEQERLNLEQKEEEVAAQQRQVEEQRRLTDAQRETLVTIADQIAQERSAIEREKELLETQKQQIEADKQKNTHWETAIAEKHVQLSNRLEKWGFRIPRAATNEPSPITYESESQVIDHIRAYIAASGFQYDASTIVNFYTCLKTRAFVVLSGLSGAGKSSLAQLFADAIGAQFRQIAVRANWTDTADLLGFLNPDKNYYYSTPFLDAIIEAQANPDRLHLICLDEMNLSRVEYYLSELLNVIDQKRPSLSLYSEKEWERRAAMLSREQQALQQGQMVLESNVRAYKHTIEIPRNVLFCGTVNIDETTQSFSDKVLDRVQIMQFEQVPFTDRDPDQTALAPTRLTPSQFDEFCRASSEQSPGSVWFEEINQILKIGGFHFGHRVKKHIDQYYTHALGSGLFSDLSADDIVDIQITQKILPKLRGVRTSEQDRMLRELQKFSAGRYTRSAEKIAILARMSPLNYWDVFRYVGDATL